MCGNCAGSAARWVPLRQERSSSYPEGGRLHAPDQLSVQRAGWARRVRRSVDSRQCPIEGPQDLAQALRTTKHWDFVAGAQIGNLEPEVGWSEWDVADAESRPTVIQDAVRAIRSIIMPFLARFTDRPRALNTLDDWPVPGLEIVPAIELALSYDDRPRAQSLLERFFVRHPDLRAEYHAKLEEDRHAGLPCHTGEGLAADLAKATIQYELTPVSAAA